MSFAAALVLLLASIAGFIHAFTTSQDKVIQYGHATPAIEAVTQ